MSKRIQQLENALQVLQACVSSTPHPLLSKDLLEVKMVDTLDDPEEPPDTSEADIHIDFGSLTISEQGVTHFVGRSGAEVLLVYLKFFSWNLKLTRFIGYFQGDDGSEYLLRIRLSPYY